MHAVVLLITTEADVPAQPPSPLLWVSCIEVHSILCTTLFYKATAAARLNNKHSGAAAI